MVREEVKLKQYRSILAKMSQQRIYSLRNRNREAVIGIIVIKGKEGMRGIKGAQEVKAKEGKEHMEERERERERVGEGRITYWQ